MLRRLRSSSDRRRRIRTAAAGLVLAVTGSVLSTATAAAQDPPVPFEFEITKGSAYIKKLDSSLALGKGKLNALLELETQKLTATITLPSVRSTFKILGFVPVTATVSITQDGPAVGRLEDGKITATAKATLKLSDADAAGIPLLLGDRCRTAQPATIDIKSGPDFNPVVGGDLLGTFAIPDFTDCGLSTPFLSLLISGPGNTITLTTRWLPPAQR